MTRRHGPRPLAAVGLAAVVLTACAPDSPGSPPPRTAAGAATTAPATCLPGAVEAGIRGDRAAGGAVEAWLAVTNRGEAACQLPGVPDLRMHDGSGDDLRVPQSRTADVPRTVLLRAGETTRAQVIWVRWCGPDVASVWARWHGRWAPVRTSGDLQPTCHAPDGGGQLAGDGDDFRVSQWAATG